MEEKLSTVHLMEAEALNLVATAFEGLLRKRLMECANNLWRIDTDEDSQKQLNGDIKLIRDEARKSIDAIRSPDHERLLNIEENIVEELEVSH